MNKIVDFNKAKEASKEKKRELEKRKKTNEKLINRMKKKDITKTFRVKYFYLGLILVITAYVLIINIQP